MKTLLLSLIISASAASTVVAQTSANPSISGAGAEQNLKELLKMSPSSGSAQVFDDRYKGIKGTPFFADSWGKARINIGNTTYQDVLVKYNIVDNEVMYQTKDGKKYVLMPHQISSFVLTDSMSQKKSAFYKVPLLATVDSELTNRFLVVLHEGAKSQFVLAPQKKLMKADFKGAYSAGREYDEFVGNSCYYLILDETAVQKVKLNKKTFLKALPAHQSKVEDFIKTNKIDLDKEEGWAQALAFYETL